MQLERYEGVDELRSVDWLTEGKNKVSNPHSIVTCTLGSRVTGAGSSLKEQPLIEREAKRFRLPRAAVWPGGQACRHVL